MFITLCLTVTLSSRINLLIPFLQSEQGRAWQVGDHKEGGVVCAGGSQALADLTGGEVARPGACGGQWRQQGVCRAVRFQSTPSNAL